MSFQAEKHLYDKITFLQISQLTHFVLGAQYKYLETLESHGTNNLYP